MEILDLLRATESFMEGHFELSSGLHSNRYCQCARMLQYPEYAEFTGKKIAEQYNPDDIDVVLGPALGGVIIGYEVARALNKPFVFTERKGGVMQLRRGFRLNEGARILIVEDVITTAKSVKENIHLLQNYNVTIAGIACILDRSKGESGIEFTSLLELEPIIFNPDECPLCKEGIELEKPGSQAKVTRYII